MSSRAPLPSMIKSESIIANGAHLKRDLPLTVARTLNADMNSPMERFTTRNTSRLISETAPMKPPVEQQQHLSKALSQNLLISQNAPAYPTMKDMMLNGHSQASVTPAELYTRMESFFQHLKAASLLSAALDNKVRVKMQVIQTGTIWRNADIPIVDHPSAFFVANQDPRVAEQFNMMSIEMK